MLQNVQRVTLSLPHAVIFQLETSIPKNKRSKFIADLIEKSLGELKRSPEEVQTFWSSFAEKYPSQTTLSAQELVRNDRSSH